VSERVCVCVCYLLCHVVQLSDNPFFYCFRRRYSRLDGTRSVSVLLAAPSSSTIIPPVCGRRRSLRVVLNVSHLSRHRLVPNRARRQSLPLQRTGLPVRMACRVHSQSVLGPSSQIARHCRGCRGHMRVQHGRLGEERYFLVVPVDEGMTRRREDVGGATLRERNDF
jgi:hypothetical protein